MKTKIIFSLLALLICSTSTLKSQQQPEQLNLPGDNLNLYAVMKVFQESETLEQFEKTINDESNRINNLDLNGDNYIDYIKVVDNVEKNVHYITLQVAVTANENQDVAVFVVRKDPDGKVIIQLIGDEALYGKYYIVEPYYDKGNEATPNPGYYGNTNNQQTTVVHHTTYYEVASWPVITFIYLPAYVVWHSPWYWGYYPTYWRPWAPWYWHEYYGYHYYYHNDYYGHYHHANHYRHEGWHDSYYGKHHASSTTVTTRTERGDFKSTYSKPESIKDGADYFKKRNPGKVTADIKDPEVKNIRTAVKSDKQNDRIKPQEQYAKPRQDNPSIDRSKEQKHEGQPGNVKSGKDDNRTGGTKPNRGSTTVKEQKKTQQKVAPQKENRQTKESPKGKETPKKENSKGSKDSKDKGRSDKR